MSGLASASESSALQVCVLPSDQSCDPAVLVLVTLRPGMMLPLKSSNRKALTRSAVCKLQAMTPRLLIPAVCHQCVYPCALVTVVQAVLSYSK